MKKAILIVCAMCATLLIMSALGGHEAFSGGMKPPAVNALVIPIDPAPFNRVDDYDIRSFPENLLYETDNAMVEVYKDLHGELALFEPLQVSNARGIARFYESVETQGTRYLESFCNNINPNINTVVYFKLIGEASNISPEEISFRVFVMFRPHGVLQPGQTYFTRSRPIKVSPADYEALSAKVRSALVGVILETKKNIYLKAD